MHIGCGSCVASGAHKIAYGGCARFHCGRHTLFVDNALEISPAAGEGAMHRLNVAL